MIHFVKGNLFTSPAQTLVNPVNTVGVMGAGLAKQFKNKYPDMFRRYRYYCKHGLFKPGQLYLYKRDPRQKWVLNFPTKKDWRNKSKMSYVKAGLIKLHHTYQEKGIKSIAFPKIGAGLGGLDWDYQVKPAMKKYLSGMKIPVFIYNNDNERKMFRNVGNKPKRNFSSQIAKPHIQHKTLHVNQYHNSVIRRKRYQRRFDNPER